MSKKNYIVSLFIPHLGCPNDCIFCNQRKITNYIEVVKKDEIRNEIKNQLANFPNKSQEDIQIAFYGGSFTGIEETAMVDYLKIANEFIEDGKVRSIRLSTRPDYIDKHILNILKEFNVETIELGVQ
ncbi:MAG: radical SAM protein, partial [Finegoldia magna]|uniref:radical SAM protein n=1 Tax=Finegoldia magna TaxID=1260 RepID=UPI002913F9DA